MLWLPVLRLSHQPRLGQPQKGVNRNFSWPHLDKSHVVVPLNLCSCVVGAEGYGMPLELCVLHDFLTYGTSRSTPTSRSIPKTLQA